MDGFGSLASEPANMRARQVINRYRDFAARTHIMMAAFAIGLVVAIIVLMIVSAVPSRASFLVAEAKNLVGVTSSGDILLVCNGRRGLLCRPGRQDPRPQIPCGIETARTSIDA
jgi:hypothetical protein